MATANVSAFDLASLDEDLSTVQRLIPQTRKIEWYFSHDNAEAYSRAVHWGCLKDRGVEKTVKEILKAQIFDVDRDPTAKISEKLFKRAMKENNPIFLLQALVTDGSFYRQLNEFMATGSRAEVYEKLRTKWSGYFTGLIMTNSAFDRFRFSGVVYRGMEISSEDFSFYRYGEVLTTKTFQSTSKSWKIAKGFARPSEPKVDRISVIVVYNIIDEKSALNVEEISKLDYEEEVLIVPGTFFIVAKIDRTEIPHEIHLNQIRWNDEF